MCSICTFFFFQAEDGIRDYKVTGVQTCALPISADRRAGALGAWVQPMHEAIVGDSRTALWLLMAAVLGLMLIACLNLANAQLGRALTRSRESAVRTALGAAKWRLMWSALAENLVLAALGGAAG